MSTVNDSTFVKWITFCLAADQPRDNSEAQKIIAEFIDLFMLAAGFIRKAATHACD